jgi:hypothetical protein
MKNFSNITFEEALRTSITYCPIKFYYNKECIWDDTLSFNNGWLPLESALDKFRKTHENYDQIVITNIEIEVVEWHHSIIYLKGKIDKKKESDK